MKKNVYDFKSDLGRLTPDPATGLTREQVDTRIAQGLTNEVKNKASKSYFRIFFDNICTFFNLFCLICFGVMLTVPATLSDYSFIVIYVLNMAIGIIQEIRAKKTVEKWVQNDFKNTKYCLTMDIDKFYPSINIGILKNTFHLEKFVFLQFELILGFHLILLNLKNIFVHCQVWVWFTHAYLCNVQANSYQENSDLVFVNLCIV